MIFDKINIELADSPELHEKGLMFRQALNEDSGMLFHFKRPQVLSFWGLNTYIPLDIAFINEDGVIIKIEKIKPFNMKSVNSELPCVRALQVNQGFFNKNNIISGCKILFEENKKDGHKLNFIRDYK